MTNGKTIALTRWTFVGKVLSLLFIFIFILASVEFIQHNHRGIVFMLSHIDTNTDIAQYPFLAQVHFF